MFPKHAGTKNVGVVSGWFHVVDDIFQYAHRPSVVCKRCECVVNRLVLEAQVIIGASVCVLRSLRLWIKPYDIRMTERAAGEIQ